MIMSSYIATKYKGKYNMRAEIDQRTGDFCRDKNGDLDNSTDVWIDCQSKGRIYHYGKSILQFYCPSLGRGHNVLKAIYDNDIGSSDKFVSVNTSKDKEGNDKETKTFDYESMYQELTSNKIIFDIEENNEEILFKFTANNLEKLESTLKPKSTCLWSPYSVKYIRQNSRKTNGKYEINSEDLARYKEITSVIPKGEMRMYIDMNNSFIDSIATKKHKSDAIKKEIKLSCNKTYEYFHALGADTWNKYLEFIKSSIQEKYN